jgi:hypothetical protein
MFPRGLTADINFNMKFQRVRDFFEPKKPWTDFGCALRDKFGRLSAVKLELTGFFEGVLIVARIHDIISQNSLIWASYQTTP